MLADLGKIIIPKFVFFFSIFSSVCMNETSPGRQQGQSQNRHVWISLKTKRKKKKKKKKKKTFNLCKSSRKCSLIFPRLTYCSRGKIPSTSKEASKLARCQSKAK